MKPPEAPAASHFIRNIVEDDVKANKNDGRVVTRFPPEPNGYLHIGHAKSICLNFGIAEQFGGVCNLRFDDTNPVKENEEFANAIKADVEWLGFEWNDLRHASDYFDELYEYARELIKKGKAYVDSSTAEEVREMRGTLKEPGTPSPYSNRSVEENLDLFERMKNGEFDDGAHILRAKIDMASGNINMRDPTLYRIRKVDHVRTGDKWSIYPMYDYTHCLSDAMENITHSLCTLEFEDHRPLYDWVLDECETPAHPQQIEFGRLQLEYTMLSKRKLIQLVEEKHVDGWDDPRMPTLAGARRRGYTPAGFKLFTDRIGVSKADSWIEYVIFEDCMREVLNQDAERRIAVLDPIKLVIDNYPENQNEDCFAPNHPLKPELGKRTVQLSKELWIEREDFMEEPIKKYFRLFPGNKVRLRYGYIVECTGCEKDAEGNVTVVHCNYLPDTKSGTDGANSVKVKGNIHWVSAKHAYEAEVRIYDRLFKDPHPGSGDRDFIDDLNPDSVKTITAQLEAGLQDVKPEAFFQFERHGYFVSDRVDSTDGKTVFNRTVSLRDNWQK